MEGLKQHCSSCFGGGVFPGDWATGLPHRMCPTKNIGSLDIPKPGTMAEYSSCWLQSSSHSSKFISIPMKLAIHHFSHETCYPSSFFSWKLPFIIISPMQIGLIWRFIPHWYHTASFSTVIFQAVLWQRKCRRLQRRLGKLGDMEWLEGIQHGRDLEIDSWGFFLEVWKESLKCHCAFLRFFIIAAVLRAASVGRCFAAWLWTATTCLARMLETTGSATLPFGAMSICWPSILWSISCGFLWHPHPKPMALGGRSWKLSNIFFFFRRVRLAVWHGKMHTLFRDMLSPTGDILLTFRSTGRDQVRLRKTGFSLCSSLAPCLHHRSVIA